MTTVPRRLVVCPAVLLLSACVGERSRAPAVAADIDSLLATAEARYWDAEYPAAAEIFETARRRSEELSDTLRLARSLTWLGLTAWRWGDYGPARARGEEALDLKLRTGLEEELFRSWNALGGLAWEEGRYADALRLLGEALEDARGRGADADVAKASNNLALTLVDLGRFDEAEAALEEALGAARAGADARVEAGVLSTLAMVDLWLGVPGRAVGRLEQARALYRSLGVAEDYVVGQHNALGQLAHAWVEMGDLQKGFAALDTALNLARGSRLRREEAATLQQLAWMRVEAGDSRAALDHLARAADIYGSLGIPGDEGNVLRLEAVVHQRLGSADLARLRAETAAERHRGDGSLDELEDLLLLAEIAAERSDPAEIAVHLRRARALVATLDVAVARRALALTEARIAERRGDNRAILEVLDRSEDDLVRTAVGVDWERHALLARAFTALGSLDSAAASGERALAALEHARRSMTSPLLRTSFAAARASAYAAHARVLLRLGRVREAFEVSDAARGRALTEQLHVARGAIPAGAPAASLAEAGVVLRRIDALLETLAFFELEGDAEEERGDGEDGPVELRARIADARAEYQALLDRAGHAGPAAVAFLGSGRVDTEAVQAALGPHEALVEYLVDGSGLLAFVVRRDSIVHHELSGDEDQLRPRVRLALELGRSRTVSDEDLGVYEALWDQLVAPLLSSGALDGVDHLVVVPHGSLTYLPFSALRQRGTGRILADAFAVSYLPAAGALPLLRGEPDPPRGVARPVTVLAPDPEGLPATKREVLAIEKASRGGRAFLGPQATERAFRESLRSSSVVHFAGHTVLNVRSPVFSRVMLAAGTGSHDDDGRLEVHELLSLRSSADLVFLSGCESALGPSWSGPFAPGEDYATLARGVLATGARSVVATLWRIDDEGAAFFAERFYHHLSSFPPVEALAATQRDVRRDPRFAAIHYWAGYQLTGIGP